MAEESHANSVPEFVQQNRRGGNPLGAVLLIAAGIVLLLNNFGILSWDIWRDIWRFWPFVFILLGLQLIVGQSRIGAFIVFLVALALIAGMLVLVSYDDKLPWVHRENNSLSISESAIHSTEYSSATERLLRVDSPVGSLTMKDASTGNLFNLESSHPGSGSEPKVEQRQSGNQVIIDVATNRSRQWFMGGEAAETTITLARPDLSTSVELEAGVGKTVIDFKEIPLQKLMLEVGTGATEVSLGNKSLPKEESRFEVGTGSMKIRLPKDVGIKLTHNVGLGKVVVGSTSLGREGTYTSPNYDTAAQKVSLIVEVGTGSVTIEQ